MIHCPVTLKNTLSPVLTAMLAILAGSAWIAEAAQADPTYRLHSARKPGQIDRVVALLEVGGDVTAEDADGNVQRAKMSVVCNLAYDEKTLEVPAGSAATGRSIRYYDRADAVLKIGEEGLIQPTLRPERRLIGVEIDSETATLFSPRGPISRKELELIDVQGNTLLLDRFLPEKAVAVGESWKHSEGLMAALLGLDAVGRADVQSELIKLTGTDARVEMSGQVDGAIYGVSTQIEIKAKYRFDLRSKRIDWFGLLVKEKRNSSRVTDGVDVVARLRIQILPKADSGQLTDAALKDLPLKPNADLRQLVYYSADGGWQLTYDRYWHVYRDRKDLAILRMVDRGEFLSQCNASSLPKLAPGKEVALAEFQNDLKTALGENFGEFVEAGQRANEANYRVYRVVIQGKARVDTEGKPADLPMQWRYYLVTDEHGRQVVFAFTVESELADQLNQADRKLVGSFRFADPQPDGKGED